MFPKGSNIVCLCTKTFLTCVLLSIAYYQCKQSENNSQLFWPSNLNLLSITKYILSLHMVQLPKKKKLTWYIHEQIPVPELHNVLSQSTRVCKFLGVIDSATNSPANCHCVPNMSDYIPICLLCDPPGTVYTFIYTWVPLSITWLLQCVAG